ncbi:GNAT family N-acetyltransferase [Streptomyces fulvoviolaceus]|uniref:GNAT family N-acetyltransferase n=1 Tax=Streptomyces fulvoviolaceus TaxID=285535 RepID=UPI000693BBD0|nr:GNAT family N-acetyltransferase [Streptomyces fulvoviolaceus]MCT9075841.1 GNAT family N-acetyltransferase [Streptomyces fulvoviolaceus]
MDTNRSFTLSSPLRLEGHGLRLREWSDEDLADLVTLYDDPEIARWTPVASPFDLDAARAYLTGAREGQAQGRKVQLAITTDGIRPLGEILLFRSQSDERDAELAYGVGAAHRGRGLAARAVRLASGYAARELRPRRVVLCIDAENAASEAVARSCGFALTDDAPVRRVSRGHPIALRTWSLRP